MAGAGAEDPLPEHSMVQLKAKTTELESQIAELRLQLSAFEQKATSQRPIWPADLGASVHVRVFEFCEFPGLPLCVQTCCSFRDMIQPELESGAMPHLWVPRDKLTLQRAIAIAPYNGTVWVAGGVYREQLRLVDDFTVNSSGVVNVIGFDNPVVAYGCELTGGNAKLSGLTFHMGKLWCPKCGAENDFTNTMYRKI